MGAAPDLQNRADIQDDQAVLQEAMAIVDAGFEEGANASVDDMRAALGELEEHFGENPAVFDAVLKGNVSVFRGELNNVLEGAEDAESLRNMLEGVRNQVQDALTQPTEPSVQAASTQESTEPSGQNVQIMRQAIESGLGDMMQAVLEKKDLFKPDSDAASKALVTMLLDEGLDQSDIDRLQAFLQKPSAFLPEDAAKYKGESSNALRAMIASADSDMQDLADQISDKKDEKNKANIFGKDERATLRQEVTDLLKKKRERKKEKAAMEFALQFKGGTRRYDSIEQVMYMTRLWLGNERNEDLPSELDIMKEMESKIDEARTMEDSRRARRLKKKLDAVENDLAAAVKAGDKKEETKLTKRKVKLEKKIAEEVAGESWGILKPRLTLILETIAEKNAYLGKIGADNLKELANNWDDKGKVEVWLNDLEGTDEHKMNKVVPPLIAYLQIAVREGLASNVPLISGKHAEGLLKHLKTIRHEKAKKLVAEKLGENATGVDAMTAYFAEIAKMTANEQEITKEHLSKSPYWKLGGKGARIGGKGIYYGGKYGGKFLLGIAGALLCLAKFGGRGAKKATEWVQDWDDDTKQGVTRGALRGVCAGVVGAGVAVAGLATLPVAALIAMPAVFTPEFIKHREAIAKGGKKALNAGGRTALYAGKLGLLGLTGGLALFSSRWRNSVRFKNF